MWLISHHYHSLSHYYWLISHNYWLPSGKRLHSYGKSPALVGKSANEMAISATLNDQNGILLRYQIFQEYMEDMGCMEYYWTIHIHM